jgi:hypothetical protein
MTNVSVTMTNCSTNTCVASRKSMRPLWVISEHYSAREQNARKPETARTAKNC